jgi:hypothetical protein
VHLPAGYGPATARLRDELLNSWRFDSLRETCVIIEDWRCDYNANRRRGFLDDTSAMQIRLQSNQFTLEGPTIRWWVRIDRLHAPGSACRAGGRIVGRDE